MNYSDLFTAHFPTIINAVQDLLVSTDYKITPNIIQQTRSRFPQFNHELISKILDIALSTHRAQTITKYASIMPWYFTEQTLMQSSEPAFANHVINRLDCRNHRFLEICTGSGMHAFSAIMNGANQVITHELDEFIASLAKMNYMLHGQEINPLCIDGSEAEITSTDIFWADPSRRKSGIERKTLTGIYSPNLHQLIDMAGQAKRGGIKIAPGERIEGEFTREFLGFGRECREQILWFNMDVIDGTVTLIDKQKTFIPDAKGKLPQLVDMKSSQTYTYLLEPHSALIRGDLTSMYVENDIAVIDRSIAYGMSNRMHDADWFAHFSILHQEKYSRRRLQECINQLKWNRLTEIKKRGFPIEPDTLRKQIKFAENSEYHGVIILTRHENDHLMFFCERT
jgi:hypothetical protein